jgi:hypothetical protein
VTPAPGWLPLTHFVMERRGAVAPRSVACCRRWSRSRPPSAVGTRLAEARRAAAALVVVYLAAGPAAAQPALVTGEAPRRLQDGAIQARCAGHHPRSARPPPDQPYAIQPALSGRSR